MSALLASIPSPDSGTFNVLGRDVHAYGLMLLLAIVAATALTWVRWKRWGGDPDLVLRTAVWGVAAGIVGARAYHDLTNWGEVPDEWWGPFAVWEGGLGVWGGILLGCLVGAVIVRRSGASVRLMMDAAAPGLLLAQGIGRWGNWWNQELYGKPTGRSWGLEIDFEHRVTGYTQYDTFHPVFLYEFVYDVLAVGVLLLVGWRFRLRPPALFALYVSLYCAFRAYEETLRIDPAHHFAGQRLNFWVSIGVFAVSTAFFVWWQFFRRGEEPEQQRAAPRAPEGPAMAIPKGRVRS